MSVVLGIDAAWTAGAPSGVGLVVSQASAWRCVAVAPSYEAFLGLAEGAAVDWARRGFRGSAADVPALLAAAHRLAGAPVDVVTIDMPVSTQPISGRRTADNAVSRAFGARGCSAHSPSAVRPGALGAALSQAFADAGFPLATMAAGGSVGPRLLEVYPHPALLSLLGRGYRVPYKVSRARRYWPSKTPARRIDALLAQFAAVYEALSAVFGSLPLPAPAKFAAKTLAALKRYEDALDALVCAWVGVQFLAGKACAYGDEAAAVWCPAGP